MATIAELLGDKAQDVRRKTGAPMPLSTPTGCVEAMHYIAASGQRVKRYLSRCRACDHCQQGMPDGDIHQVYQAASGRVDGHVHERCIQAFIEHLDMA